MWNETERVVVRPTSRRLAGAAHDGGAPRVAGAAILAATLAIAGCEPIDRVQERFRAATAHEAYAHALAEAGLATTALARDWAAAARRALARPTPVGVPYRETGYLPPEAPAALGYRIEIGRGQRLVAELEFEPTGAGDAVRPADPPLVFMDLYRLGGDSAAVPYHEVSADSGALRLEHEPWRGGTFVLRVQPELLRGGRYTLTIHNAATLTFPVDGADARDIGSIFGDPRDGGRRDHQGVDIFAPRGTPAIAAVDGTVRRVRTTRLGGKVVWLRDRARNQSLYYAHLDTQLVRDGMRVRVGDTLGLVGNTGNARTTPPHLHFGVYRRGQGPVDPLPFLFARDTVAPPVRADPTLIGRWARTTTNGARLRSAPGRRASVIAELPAQTALRIVAATGDWYRVRLPDGRRGHLFARLAEPLDGAVAERVIAAPARIRARPTAGAPVIDSIADHARIPVLGRFGAFLLVRAPSGATGWLATDRAVAVKAADADG
ncbi:MAG TPA: M23 family metallopeptidase [Longimicrobiales bacterium]